MTRVMVTGAAGFIGSELVRALNGNGVDTVAVDCYLPDSYSEVVKRARGAELAGLKNVRVFEADIRNPLPLSIWDGVTSVINLAAMPGLVKSWSHFDLYQSCNFSGVNTLLSIAMKQDIQHFIQISTSSVYGSLATESEDQPLRPVSPYGVTKLAGERLVAAYGMSQDLPFSILRYFSVYGPEQRSDMAFHIICERLLDGKPITIYGDGLQTRSCTYVDDTVRATMNTLERGALNDAINIAGGENISLLDAISVLENALGKTAKLEFRDARIGDQRHTGGSTEKAIEMINYRAEMPVNEGLRSQAHWHLSRRASHY